MQLHNIKIKSMSNFLTRISTIFLAIATISCKPSGLRTHTHLVSPRIFGGVSVATRFQFPFIVSIGVYNTHKCGGSIINERWVITAGHCVYNNAAEDLFMLAGTNQLDSGGFKYNVMTVIVHSGFVSNTLENDIALLKNLLHFCFGPTVQKIPIGSVEPFQPVVTAGWGYFDKEKRISKSLKYAEMSTRHPHNCGVEGLYYNLTKGKLCVMEGDKGSPCRGDSGGPLVYRSKLVGVVSFVNNGCGGTGPYVYTDLSYYKNWIEERIEGCLC